MNTLEVITVMLLSSLPATRGFVKFNCSSEGFSNVDCSNKSLDHPPTCEQLKVDCSLVKNLNLQLNQIRSLNKGDFQKFYSLERLVLNSNPIQRFFKGTFDGLSKLRYLYMNNIQPDEKLVSYDKEIFKPLTSLEYLDLSDSPLNIYTLLNTTLCSLSPGMKTLLLNNIRSYNYLVGFNINVKFASCIGRLNLQHLEMESNNIAEFSADAILKVRHLKYISLRKNILVTSPVLAFTLAVKNATFADFSCQHSGCSDEYSWSSWLPGEPKEYPINFTYVNNGEYVNSAAKNKNDVSIFGLPHLQTIRASNIPNSVITIPYHRNVCWINNHLVNVDYSHSHLFSINGISPCNDFLKYLNLRHTTIRFTDSSILHGMPNLEVLLLGSSTLPNFVFDGESGKKILRMNKKLKFLDLSGIGLADLNENTFGELRQLQVLILSDNKLSSFDNLFVNLTSIRHIDLSNNKLTNLPFRLFQHLEGIHRSHPDWNMSLHLQGNPFNCTCGDTYIIKQLLLSKITIEQVNESNGTLTCRTTKGILSLKQAFLSLNEHCDNTILITLIYLQSLICIIFMLFTYRYKLKIKIILYAIRRTMDNKHNEKDGQFKYDAFVCYSSENEEWIRTMFLPNLENGPQNYHLCLHYRHFLAGMLIADNIEESLKNSRMVILIVTKEFLNSEWCDFESRSAQVHHLGNSKRGIIAVVFPKALRMLRRCRKYKSLRRLLDTVTYLEWTEDKDEQILFWMKIRRSLGKPLERQDDLLQEQDNLYTTI